MPRFFSEDIGETGAVIAGEDARHIARSLRMQMGEELTLCDMQGTDYRCVITQMEPEAVHLDVLDKAPSKSEAACRIRLYQALPKGDKLEFIVQKATELGVAEIVPIITARCISRPHVRTLEKKRERLQRIAYEAAKQSGRGLIPEILPTLSFSQAVHEMADSELPILFYEESSKPLRRILRGNPDGISIMVGCEGGFTAREVSEARDAGVYIASLGSRVLRCETAPICALSAILFYLGEF